MPVIDSSQKAKSRITLGTSFFPDYVHQLIQTTLLQFRHITRSYVIFNLCFFLAGFIEVLALILFFPFFAKSSLVAFSIGIIFLTSFSYFILRFYLHAKKPEQFLRLKEDFVSHCLKLLSDEKNSQLSLTDIIYQLIDHLEGQEYQYYRASSYFKSLQPLLAKFSLWCHWQDVHLMKELWHLQCIQEHLELIKKMPTDPQVHSSLGLFYVALYKLYIDPRKLGKQIPYAFIIEQYQSETMIDKFKHTAKRAIEEFKILDDYTPNNLWVHAQLAAIYHDLELLNEEMAEYEIMRQIAPDDKEILFKLGALYFQQGKNAQGLRLYQELKDADDPQAKVLIQFYN